MDTRLFVLMKKDREIIIVSDGNELNGLQLIKTTILNSKVFMKKYKFKDDTMKERE